MTDHGWGGNMIVMGGAVAGGQIHGQYPEALLIGDGLDVGNKGRLLPTTSCDVYFSELLRWFGVSPSQMSLVLPNIKEFYDPYSNTTPIGCLH